MNLCGQFHSGDHVKVCTVGVRRTITSPETDHVVIVFQRDAFAAQQKWQMTFISY